jgi:hypothetical protein
MHTSSPQLSIPLLRRRRRPRRLRAPRPVLAKQKVIRPRRRRRDLVPGIDLRLPRPPHLALLEPPRPLGLPPLALPQQHLDAEREAREQHRAADRRRDDRAHVDPAVLGGRRRRRRCVRRARVEARESADGAGEPGQREVDGQRRGHAAARHHGEGVGEVDGAAEGGGRGAIDHHHRQYQEGHASSCTACGAEEGGTYQTTLLGFAAQALSQFAADA